MLSAKRYCSWHHRELYDGVPLVESCHFGQGGMRILKCCKGGKEGDVIREFFNVVWVTCREGMTKLHVF